MPCQKFKYNLILFEDYHAISASCFKDSLYNTPKIAVIKCIAFEKVEICMGILLDFEIFYITIRDGWYGT